MNVVSQERGKNAKRTASPAWGVGLSYRFCIHREVRASADDINFLEIPALDYVHAYRRKYADPGEVLLKEAVSRFPAVGHGADISVGSPILRRRNTSRVSRVLCSASQLANIPST